MDDHDYGRTIIFGGYEYTLGKDDRGEPILKRYNEEYKMWTEISFSKTSNNVKKEVTEILARELLSTFT